MKFINSAWLRGLLATPRREPGEQARRIVAMQRQIVLPAKAGIIAVVLFYIFHSDWLYQAPSTYDVALDFLRKYFLVYSICNIIIGSFFVWWQRFSPGLFQWLVFVLGFLDGLFVASLVFITDGFESIAYWIFPALIVLNALSIPLATPQIVLNGLLGIFYLSAGVMNAKVPLQPLPAALLQTSAHFRTNNPSRPFSNSSPVALTNRVMRLRAIKSDVEEEQVAAEKDLPRLILLWLLTACCYGAQVLAERQRQVLEEAREFAVREAQLRSAGRVAAEFAHQIKNPLAIINNTVFSLERSLKGGRDEITKQLEIIREEVERSDKIVTQIMGYGQLTEGHVEKLDLPAEMDRAIEQTFPSAIETGVEIERRYAAHCPPTLMQRQHLSQILVNILQNAREALNGKGKVIVTIANLRDESIEISVADDGPGIPADKTERVFEQYYSTKEKGTGLGLSIVKHNVELYAGRVRVESRLGKGARFILTFPAKTVMNVTP
jgi:signal transduction histidine kinase